MLELRGFVPRESETSTYRILKDRMFNEGLRFGEHGVPFIWDCRQLALNGDSLETFGRWMARQINKHEPELLVGSGIGALPLLQAVARELHPAPKIIWAYNDILCNAPPRKNMRTVFIDDVTNRGWTFRRLSKLLKPYNPNFVASSCIIDLYGFTGTRQFQAKGITPYCLFFRHEFGFYRNTIQKTSEIVGKKLWQRYQFNLQTNHSIKSVPVIYKDTLIAANDQGQIESFDLDTGESHWQYSMVRYHNITKGYQSRLQVLDGKVYAAGYDGFVVVLDAETGQVEQLKYVDNWLHSTPYLNEGGRELYVGTERLALINGQWQGNGNDIGGGDVVCLDLDNLETRWRVATGSYVPCSPNYSSKHNQVISGSNDGHLYLIEAYTGQVLHKLPMPGMIKGRAVVDDDYVWVCTENGWLCCIYLPTGKVEWSRQIGLTSHHIWPILKSGLLITTNSSNQVLGIDPKTGKLRWLTNCYGTFHYGPTEYGQRDILLADTQGYLLVVNARDGKKVAQQQLDWQLRNLCQAPVFDRNHLAVVSSSGTLAVYEHLRKA